MADYDRRSRGGRGDYNNRKRRYRDDDDYDRRGPQRRRYEEPFSSRIRKQILSIAESPLKPAEEEVHSLAKAISENYDDVEVKNTFLELTLTVVREQPFKIPFMAAVVVVLNGLNRGEEAVGGKGGILEACCQDLEDRVAKGEWRDVKLLLRFLGSLQGIFEEDGVFPVLTELFERAVDLQTATADDTLGTELVKIVLFTIPYIMASSSATSHEAASSLLEKTGIVAGAPHVLEHLVDPYPGDGGDASDGPMSVISMLQKQLEGEATRGWELACIPRAWKEPVESGGEDMIAAAPKHTLPAIKVPETVIPGLKPLFPDVYFSVYANQDVETVPPSTDIASSILRDALTDTINILDFNRMATARFLIDLDCYFSAGTFVKRATPFDRLRDLEGDRSTWKPEDVAVDAVFSQLFQLPGPEHKLIYYHSVLTEACKIAPAAIAPSLGRAIRYLYKNIDLMDLELACRFMDWFAHHLSNFGFTWKWTEWADDVDLPSLHPKHSFIRGALEKEIRLSFAQRIKGTLPEPYQVLISQETEKDTPDFKYDNEVTPFSSEGKEMLSLLKKKAPESEIDTLFERIHTQATDLALQPELCSTDAYLTSICYIGSKSLSHVLSQIDRCKERLLSISGSSPAAQKQIINSVMDYWKYQSGVGVKIVDKLLNYTILTPDSVIEWALSDSAAKLAEPHVFEMVELTVQKVAKRVRQIVKDRNVPGLTADQKVAFDEMLIPARKAMKDLFTRMEDELLGWTSGGKDEMMDGMTDGSRIEELDQIKKWAQRWLIVTRRRAAVEEAWFMEAEAAANALRILEQQQDKGDANGVMDYET